jgi:SNF2 family DNA or RNA helicase
MVATRTYGTIDYQPGDGQGHGWWLLKCEPHVSIRLKRVFGKLSSGSVGTHQISDTPENAHDLEWFLERYPMVAPAGEGIADRLYARSDEHRHQLDAVGSILSANYVAPEFDLATPAREYQKVAAAMLLNRGGLLLADDVGIGKTCSAICALTDPRTLPALVVTLTHLPKQWQAELKKFAPKLTTHIIKQGTPYPLSFTPDVILINYHKLAGWAETLAKVVKSVTFDECQELRRPNSAKYAAAKHIAGSAFFRCGCSATPIYNYGGEIWTVLDVLFPGQLGTFEEFTTEWCPGWSDPSKARIRDPKAFGLHLRENGMMLRRTRADVGRDLPACQVIPHYVESDPEYLNRVKGSCVELAKLILSTTHQERGVQMHAAEQLSNKLRQATGIAKAPYVAEFVRLLIESGEKVVLYGWHRECYALWAKVLEDFKPAFYTGTESIPQKEESKRRFIAGDTPLLIISLRAGAGMDGLQKVCRTVVFGELDWSPGVHEQCTGRIYRDGQPDAVTAYYLLAEDGSDPIVSEVLGVKRQQIEGIRKLSDEQLIETLQNDGSHIRRLAQAVLANGL